MSTISDGEFVPTGHLGRDLAKYREITLGVKTIPKASQSGIIPDRRASALKRINDIKNEVGRLNRLLDELQADVLRLLE